MIDKQHILTLLGKISSSKGFVNSNTNNRLLNYLVRASLEDKIPKEIDIAIDFFGKDASFNSSSDSIVRSHIYQLRNKLEKYYLTEGKNDNVRFIIPRGHYQVVFTDPPPTSLKRTTKTFLKLCISIIILLIVLLIGQTIYFTKQNKILNKQSTLMATYPIWQDILENPKPVLLVLGDYFVFYEKETPRGSDRKIRDGSINSIKDLEIYIKENPDYEDMVTGVTASYLQPTLTQILKPVISFLTVHKKTFEIKSSRWVTDQDLLDYNIIFWGPYKTLYKFNDYVQKLQLQYQIYPHKIFLDEKEQSFDYLATYLPDKKYYRKDFVLFAKMPGPSNNLVYLLSSFSPTSLTDTIDFISTNEFREEFISANNGEKNYPNFFELLIEVNGFNNDVSLEVTHFFPIIE